MHGLGLVQENWSSDWAEVLVQIVVVVVVAVAVLALLAKLLLLLMSLLLSVLAIGPVLGCFETVEVILPEMEYGQEAESSFLV